VVRIIILTRKSPFNYYLVNRIASEHKISGIVWETIPFKKKIAIMLKRLRRLGIWKVIDQLLLMLYIFIAEGSKNRRKLNSIFTGCNVNRLISQVPELPVKDINSPEVLSFINNINPELIIVSGTMLLKPALVNSLPGRIVNIHVGITPQYRGAHGGFWAVYNQEPEKAGVTVHLVDAGIDTGSIISQEVICTERDDTLHSIIYKQQKIGADLVMKAIARYQEGDLEGYTKPDSTSQLYYSPGLTDYFKFKRALGKIPVTEKDPV
jgi:folate-dependent phosphoribosylglycinamide formyltransferase PurN